MWTDESLEEEIENEFETAQKLVEQAATFDNEEEAYSRAALRTAQLRYEKANRAKITKRKVAREKKRAAEDPAYREHRLKTKRESARRRRQAK